MSEQEDRFGQRGTRPWLPRKWAIILLIPVLAIYIYSKKQTYDNPNPLQRVETSEEYIWPAGCSEEAYEASMNPSNANIPCACADSEYEITDWYERGLSPWGQSRKSLSYYRIENDAAAIKRNKSNANLCTNYSRDALDAANFFKIILENKI
ncbi:hypothetical protein [Sphingorhabdus sp.]|uniref:hypothetical protein n=1 Tax=Sphingorhabdus sp. TaxID=1902408 RepID=UPI0037C993A6